MALAQKQEDDLHTPVTHYEILTERLKDARIDRLEEVITEKFNAVNEKFNMIHERIKSTNERIEGVKKELLTEIKSTKFILVLVFMGVGFSALFAFMGFSL